MARGYLLVCDTESGDHYFGPLYMQLPEKSAEELAREVHPEEFDDGHWYVYGRLVEVEVLS